MKNVKTKLIDKMGIFGYIAYAFIVAIYVLFPFYYIDVFWWIRPIMAVIMFSAPTIGSAISVAGWVWSLYAVLPQPVELSVFVYYLMLAITVFVTLVPFCYKVIDYFKKRSD